MTTTHWELRKYALSANKYCIDFIEALAKNYEVRREWNWAAGAGSKPGEHHHVLTLIDDKHHIQKPSICQGSTVFVADH